MTVAVITWQQRFVNRFIGRVIRDANQRLYLAFDAMIRARGCPAAQRSLAAAEEYEQRFGGKTCFGGKLAAQTFETAPQRRSHFGASVLKSVAAAVRAVMPTHREGNSRASAPRTRQTGSNATKTAAGDSGDPDPEPRHPSNPICITRLIAANFRQGGAAA